MRRALPIPRPCSSTGCLSPSPRSSPDSTVRRNQGRSSWGKAMPSLTRFLFLLLLPALAHALLVAPNSPCAPQCGNVLTTTSGAEISCNDGDYASSTYGPAFQSCLNCELASTYVDPQSNMTDLQAALYNLRFAVSWCLWGYENNTNVADTSCLTTSVASLS